MAPRFTAVPLALLMVPVIEADLAVTSPVWLTPVPDVEVADKVTAPVDAFKA